jgi:hypothetical protein
MASTDEIANWVTMTATLADRLGSSLAPPQYRPVIGLVAELMRVGAGQIRKGQADRAELLETIERHRDVQPVDLDDERRRFRAAMQRIYGDEEPSAQTP